MDSKKIENAFVEVIEALGNVQYKKELKDTPKRIADNYKKIFQHPQSLQLEMIIITLRQGVNFVIRHLNKNQIILNLKARTA